MLQAIWDWFNGKIGFVFQDLANPKDNAESGPQTTCKGER
jgi:hypothetical protein